MPFDLRHPEMVLSDPEKRRMVESIFPGTTAVAYDGFFITIQLRTLPPKPWPVTIGGAPLFLTLGIEGPGGPFPTSPMPLGKGVDRNNGSIAEDKDGPDMRDWEALFRVIKDHFERLGVAITEVIYWGNCVMIVLKDRDTEMGKLPFRATKVACRYLFDDEMARPSALQARRRTDPAPGIADERQYDILQPGLRVSSSYLRSDSSEFHMTTSGVLVKDNLGNEFMTIASHGFPAEGGIEIFHALPADGRKIGGLVMEISSADVALVKLEVQKYSPT